MSVPDETSLRAAFDAAGQSHVFKHWDKCSLDERASLLQQLSEIDLDFVTSVFTRSMRDHTNGVSSKGAIEPVVPDADASDSDNAGKWHRAGLTAAKNGELAVVLLAGGQGTRLGSSAPKGMYDIGLPSGRTLFQLQCERLLKLTKMAEELVVEGDDDDQDTNPEPGNLEPKVKVTVPLYVMTSPFTHRETKHYFESHDFFGLPKESVAFFQQGWLPCFSEEPGEEPSGDDKTKTGKILMKSKHEIATAPDGNGGVYKALELNGCIDDMTKKGVKHVYAYCVDNAAVQVGDPTFVGFCALNGFQAGAKVIKKAYPDEPVGVFTRRDGKVHVVEYSEMPDDLNTAVDESGNLKFDAANVVLHYYSLAFLKKCCDLRGEVQSELAYHVARKQIPSVSDDGVATETPQENNGVKLEAFIFDVYAFCDSVGFLNGTRGIDFAPVKNKEGTGKDSPDTARQILSTLHRKWIENASGAVSGDETSPIEVAPAVSFDGNEVAFKEFVNGKSFATGSCLETNSWVLSKAVGAGSRKRAGGGGDDVDKGRATKK